MEGIKHLDPLFERASKQASKHAGMHACMHFDEMKEGFAWN
jgi:hypothetical protein